MNLMWGVLLFFVGFGVGRYLDEFREFAYAIRKKEGR